MGYFLRGVWKRVGRKEVLGVFLLAVVFCM